MPPAGCVLRWSVVGLLFLFLPAAAPIPHAPPTPAFPPSFVPLSPIDPFQGADEVDSRLNLIKGGGGCHLLEKLVASAAKQLVIVVDPSKISQRLGERWKKGIPIEVLPEAYTLVMAKIARLGGEACLRMAAHKAGPVVTDSGNFILDADFGVLGMCGPLPSRRSVVLVGVALTPFRAPAPSHTHSRLSSGPPSTLPSSAARHCPEPNPGGPWDWPVPRDGLAGRGRFARRQLRRAQAGG